MFPKTLITHTKIHNPRITIREPIFKPWTRARSEPIHLPAASLTRRETAYLNLHRSKYRVNANSAKFKQKNRTIENSKTEKKKNESHSNAITKEKKTYHTHSPRSVLKSNRTRSAFAAAEWIAMRALDTKEVA